MKVDYLIVGGGLSGLLLAYNLQQAGCSLLVVDDGSSSSASRVAGGIINPVTGMRLVQSWQIDRLLPFALQTYRMLEKELGVELITECSQLDFFANPEQRSMFDARSVQGNHYLHSNVDTEAWQSTFRFNYGAGEIAPCILVDLRSLLERISEKLMNTGMYRDGEFNWDDCEVGSDKVSYSDVEATMIICCEGAMAADNPYFSLLPWSKDKGEAIIASIPGLPRQHIYRQHFGIVPWQRDDLFWIGATHDWKYNDLSPTADYLKKVTDHLDYFLRLPYSVVDHLVARRPANLDRKPFVGVHPSFPSVAIFNGMGGKGVSMAPFFASQLALHLTNNGDLWPEVNVQRFKRVLSVGR